jgi:hypothetical protein
LDMKISLPDDIDVLVVKKDCIGCAEILFEKGLLDVEKCLQVSRGKCEIFLKNCKKN